jgi:hypothetical protein
MPPEAFGQAPRGAAACSREDAVSPRAAALPARGGYARQEVEIGALRSTAQPLELSLALPFGVLFSALLPARSFRVRQLQLDYVDTDRLGPSATYSAQVGDAHDGALELRLLVARGARLCVRGRALLEIAALDLALPSVAAPDRVPGKEKAGNPHG